MGGGGVAKRKFCQGVNSLQTHQLVLEQQS